MNALREGSTVNASDSLTLSAPDVVEDGRVVPIHIQSKLIDIEILWIFAAENTEPFVAAFKFGPQANLPIDFRLKLKSSQEVVVVARANGELYKATKKIQVVLGGCGPDA